MRTWKYAGDDLVLPDPEILARPFLLHALAELAPDLVLPGQQATLSELAAALATGRNAAFARVYESGEE